MSLEPSRSSAAPPSCLIPDRIPLFPLPNIVLFPRTFLPLHIFEPRYRQMVIDVTTAGHCIGMALFKEGWEEHYYGNPAIYELGCMGRVVSIEKLADGRSNIMLEGLCRYKIREEESECTPYRQARVVPALEETCEPLASQLRAGLRAVLHESLAYRDRDETWGEGLESEVSDEVLVNILSASLDFTPLEQQLLLEADTIQQRARRLSDLLQLKRYERDDRKGRG
jgi:uncharacterized protein